MIEPRPTILFVCCSVVTIVACVLGLASLLGSLGWEVCTLIGISIFAPFPLLLGIQQYRATFRRAPGPAKFIGIFFYVIAALGGFGYVTNVGEAALGGFGYVANVGEAALKPGNLPISWTAIQLWPLLAISLISLILGWQNWLWFKKLKQYYAANESSPPGGRFTLCELFLGVSIIAIIAGLSTSVLRNYHPSAAIRVTPEESGLDLPADASDVSYARGYRGTIAYEFTADETSFRNWVVAGIDSPEAQAANEQVRQITQPVEVTRYTSYTNQFPGATTANISDGLVYSWSYKDRGFIAVFDRAKNRVYVHRHST